MSDQPKDNPHIRPYMWVIRELNEQRRRKELLILLELMCHADPLGRCYPGMRRLGEQTGYAETTARAAFNELMRRDWVRVTATVNERRNGQVELDYQLSPAVIALRPELREEAWALFNTIIFRNTLDEIVTNDSQPTRTSSTNQRQQPATSQPPPVKPMPKPAPAASQNGEKPSGYANGSEDGTSEQPAGQPTEKQNDQKQKAKSNSAAPQATAHNIVQFSSAKKSPPVAEHPPLPDDVDLQEALANARDESAAQEVYRMFDALQLRYARRYVVLYGRNKVLAAAIAADRAPHIRNPVGKMDADLRRGLVDDADGSTDGSRFVSGKYADAIES